MHLCQYIATTGENGEKNMNLIVAVDENWAIGYQNQLLAHIPEDMKYFREKTKNQVVVMGRKTLESFPGGKPLKNRVNIVLSTNPEYRVEGATVVSSIAELREALVQYESEEVFVIGGARIYKELLALCDTAYITKIEKAYAPADTYFPDLDNNPEWKLVEKGEEKEHEGEKFRFTVYQRITR